MGKRHASIRRAAPAIAVAFAAGLGLWPMAGSSGAQAQPAGNAGTTCRDTSRFDPAAHAGWPGWSPTLANTRFQTAAQAGLGADEIKRLELKWAFGFPATSSARGMLTVAGGRLFVGSNDGTVYALDTRTGCTAWAFKAKASVRSAVVIGRAAPGGELLAFFGDGRSNVYAVHAATGAQVWTRSVDEHPASHVTGAPALHEGRLYVPVASLEEVQGMNAKYECCTFRGSVVALDAATGGLVWKTYTIDAEPRALGKNRGGSTRYGPSGAGVWASPTVDTKRRRLYAATGNMYTEPQQPTSDAVVAFELDTGRIAWTMQATPKDVFVVGCNSPNAANCPPADDLGPDFDFGNPPMLVTLAGGREAIVIGQKSGVGFALDPDRRGAILWQYRAGQGSPLGGMEFGSAADAERAYFPVADPGRPTAGELHAVRLDTGARVWQATPRPVLCGTPTFGCSPAILAAITATPAAVFAGALDGGIRAYAVADGSLLWEFDTNREFTTVNQVAARGASINGPGPIVAGGMLFVNSGYGVLGGRPGNVLLAFGVGK
jgi:polyvinyl alcohol dehydrogenase (cytochrome)